MLEWRSDFHDVISQQKSVEPICAISVDSSVTCLILMERNYFEENSFVWSSFLDKSFVKVWDVKSFNLVNKISIDNQEEEEKERDESENENEKNKEKEKELKTTRKKLNGYIQIMHSTNHDIVWLASYKNVIRLHKSLSKPSSLSSTTDIINCLETTKDERSAYQIWIGCNDGHLFLWDYYLKRFLCKLTDNSRISGLLIIDDKFLWTCGWDKFIRVWSLDNNVDMDKITGDHPTNNGFVLFKTFETLHKDMICSLLCVHEKSIWSASWDSTICVYSKI